VKPVIVNIADLDITTDRGVDVPAEVLTTDANEAIANADIVVETVGGTTIAKTFILKALEAGKNVVTANKALLAEFGEELFDAAEKTGVNIYYEAAVAGGIPIIKALREGLVSNRIKSIYGIMNGTCNYILTRMEREGLDFDVILKDAQEVGYAEAEPSLDVDGFDTAHKTAVLTALAYGEWVGMDPIYVEGIRDITVDDIKNSDELGYRIKLLAVIKENDGKVEARVSPTLVPKNKLIAQVSDVFNAVAVTGDTVDETMYYGRGAGRDATASDVVADVVDACLNINYDTQRRIPAFKAGKLFDTILPMEETTSRFYLSMVVEDKSGVIAKISKVLGDKGISISSFTQKEGEVDGGVPIIILTHEAIEKDMTAAISEVESLPEVKDKVKFIRIEDM
jgi:homoserine dehydrogenase